MNRIEFQSLAEERLLDAEALLASGRYAGAYYLAGYAVECALKACIARRTRPEEFPPKNADKFYIHDLQRLLEYVQTDLTSNMSNEETLNPAIRTKWAVVKDWNEHSRYDSRDRSAAVDLIGAINDSASGVMQWLRKNW